MKFLTAKDLVQLLGMSESYCYRLIRRLNEELDDQGYLTIPGRVPAQYFYDRCYKGRDGGGDAA